MRLLESLAAGSLPPRSIPVEIISTLRASRHNEVREAAERLWGRPPVRESSVDARVDALAESLQTRSGDRAAGRALFQQLCASCHTLFDIGARVGPDLTGIDRRDRKALLRAILDPSEVVLPEYQGWEFELADASDDSEAQFISGFIERETPETLTIRNAAGTEQTIPKAAIRHRSAMSLSVMPEGLIDSLTPDQIADLFSFLEGDAAPADAD